MAKVDIFKMEDKETGHMVVPITIYDAVVNPKNKKTLDAELSELGQEIGVSKSIILKSSDLVPIVWNGTKMVSSSTYNIWIIPLKEGVTYSWEYLGFFQAKRVCSEYPELGKQLGMTNIQENKITATNNERYLVLTVDLSLYNNEDMIVSQEESGISKRITDLGKEVESTNEEVERINEEILSIRNSIGFEGGEYSLSASDLVPIVWDGTKMVSSSSYGIWIVPLPNGNAVVKYQKKDYFQGVRVCMEYPELGMKLNMVNINAEEFEVDPTTMKYLVVTVTLNSYNNESFRVEISGGGLVNSIKSLEESSEKLEDTVGGYGYITKYSVLDLCGIIYNGVSIVASTDKYNSLLVELQEDREIKVKKNSSIFNIWGYKDKPVLGLRETPVKIDVKDEPVPINKTEELRYVLITVDNLAFTEAEISTSGFGLAKDVEDIQNDLKYGELKKALEGKTIVCFGDSLTEFNGTDGKGYGDYLADLSGARVVRGGIGGAELATRKTPILNPTDYQQAYGAVDISNLVKAWANNDWAIVDNAVEWLTTNKSDNNKAVIDRLKACPIEETDIVTIFGGTNDCANETFGKPTDTDPIMNTCAGINQIIASILSVKPSITIYFFTPTPRLINGVWCDEYRSGKTESDGSDLSYKGLVKRIKECVLYNHIPCCDMYSEIGINRQNIYTYAEDGTHPNNGYSMLANRMFGFIMANRNWKID